MHIPLAVTPTRVVLETEVFTELQVDSVVAVDLHGEGGSVVRRVEVNDLEGGDLRVDSGVHSHPGSAARGELRGVFVYVCHLNHHHRTSSQRGCT